MGASPRLGDWGYAQLPIYSYPARCCLLEWIFLLDGDISRFVNRPLWAQDMTVILACPRTRAGGPSPPHNHIRWLQHVHTFYASGFRGVQANRTHILSTLPFNKHVRQSGSSYFSPYHIAPQRTISNRTEVIEEFSFVLKRPWRMCYQNMTLWWLLAAVRKTFSPDSISANSTMEDVQGCGNTVYMTASKP